LKFWQFVCLAGALAYRVQMAEARLEEDAGTPSSTKSSFDNAALQIELMEEERMAKSDRKTSYSLLNAELSAMITLLRKQMSGARFFSDTGPIVLSYFTALC